MGTSDGPDATTIRTTYRRPPSPRGDSVNQALSAATTCLYGIVHAVVVALGCSPGLGFVHTGHDRSFVFDLADLYKADYAIPVAFDVVSEGAEDIPAATRRAVRDAVHAGNLLERCCKDIHALLLPDQPDAAEQWDTDVVELWDRKGTVAGGISYTDEDEVPW
ncbi:CRISPR-associated endonuclease Cas1 [Nocardia sp. NPDC003482]